MESEIPKLWINDCETCRTNDNLNRPQILSRKQLCEKLRSENDANILRARSASPDTYTNTKKRKKSVRFATTFGLNLDIQINTYDSEIPPEVPDYILSPLLDSLKLDNEFEENNQPIESDLIFTRNFNEISEYNFHQEITSRNVVLLKLDIDNQLLHGIIGVHNLFPEKSVICRITWNKWKSFIDISSTYLSSINNQLDKFQFSYSLPSNSLEFGSFIEFALRLTGHGQELWDNNFGNNYKLIRTFNTEPVNSHTCLKS